MKKFTSFKPGELVVYVGPIASMRNFFNEDNPLKIIRFDGINKNSGQMQYRVTPANISSGAEGNFPANELMNLEEYKRSKPAPEPEEKTLRSTSTASAASSTLKRKPGELTARQQEALQIKGDHKIYFEDGTADYAKAVADGEMDQETADDFLLFRTIADLDEVEIISTDGKPDDLDGRAYIPDWSPDWLYDILDLFDACEEMESIFSFGSKEDADEFKEICDFVNE